MVRKKGRTGLVLSGGGARGAYQVGALVALAEICKELKLEHPFPIITGTSAGAINAVYLASHAHHFLQAPLKLKQLWETMYAQDVYRTDISSLLKVGLRLLLELASGGLYKKKQARALLDTTPLKELIATYSDFDKLKENIDKKILHGLAITTMNYTTGNSRIFYQGHKSIKPWKRIKRLGMETEFSVNHILASSAIPILFPPVKIHGHYYGDGSLRNYTPLSPAIKLGADKIMVIGVRQTEKKIDERVQALPSLARVLSIMLNSVLLDAIDLDYDSLSRINETIGTSAEEREHGYRPIDLFMIHPSMDIGKIALEEMDHLPPNIAYLLKGLGTKKEAADLTSFLRSEEHTV